MKQNFEWTAENKIHNSVFESLLKEILIQIKDVNISYDEIPFGKCYELTIPSTKKKYLIDTTKLGKIEYKSPIYDELLNLSVKTLNNFKNND